ncbi:hypothetical protein ACFLRF_03265 [Candidatus Altiarchaeota archaeon]
MTDSTTCPAPSRYCSNTVIVDRDSWCFVTSSAGYCRSRSRPTHCRGNTTMTCEGNVHVKTEPWCVDNSGPTCGTRQTKTCNATCGSPCTSPSDCPEKTVDRTRYYNGHCDPDAGCACAYDTETLGTTTTTIPIIIKVPEYPKNWAPILVAILAIGTAYWQRKKR